ncbi:ATP-binding cassette domain-containing protein [Macrococcus brunensis]|uniref:ATP-binding cassette domain-containing protein n=1 Tax=Macrococcus brunensis TaxID=198483 RepID=UPI001EF10467|nr:ATP-binding cassette domain-containing protein [Macrococcus brunensis]ULG73137.1 ATP-binding cassette domain-containing protein [Macrococcus brunensis]
MIIKNYSLKLKSNTLIDNSNLKFYQGEINHVLGKNGVGKSQFAIDLYLNSSHYDIKNDVSLISSMSNIPKDITSHDLINFLQKKFGKEQLNHMIKLLNINNIDRSLLIGKLSDGQKQKLKILSFFCEDKNIIILDEITNALDKSTVSEIQRFIMTYANLNKDKVIINITHNLSDLRNMPGRYFYLHNKLIEEYSSKDRIIEDYINED